MSRTEAVEIFQFDELSDKAKEKARGWWRELEQGDTYYSECVVESFETVCNLLGVKLKTRPIPLMNGKTREEPCISWRGFWSQGDGASFEGTYRYAKGSAKKIREEFGPCESHQELYRIADGLAELQRKNFYSIFARIYRSGHYCHEYTMRIECAEDTRRGTDLPIEVEKEVLEFMRDMARWFYKQLEENYWWTMADEQVDDSIRSNEYEFAADGSIWRSFAYVA